MPKGYQHLTRDQRCQIDTLKASGFLQREIADRLGVSASTISRELKRNSSCGEYTFHDANRVALYRRWKASAKPRCMIKYVVKRIEGHLCEEWSPEQISGRLKLEGIFVSHERIYQHVWRDKKVGGALFNHLRRQGRKYYKRSSGKAGRGQIPNRVDIKERPEIVETKSRVGDWEGDTIIGANHQGAILSYVERKSKFTVLSKLTQKTAKNVASATIKRFSKLGQIHTITYDNGKEFSSHELISKKTGASCYFATPYHSWERGLNEHTNGLVRQYFPKSTSFENITEKEIKKVENLLNNRPRKVLGYLKPKEVYMHAMHARS